MDAKKSDSELLEMILERKCINPVYQPIVSLADGTIYGYEALSRISDDDLKMDIEQMFRTADKINKSWELETLCRSRSIASFISTGNDRKLFLNVNSNIIYDEKFKEGFTKQHLSEHGIDANKIIFEITERVAAVDNNAFFGAVDHYKDQSYGIAIDDVGSGYSGLNAIADIKPNYIKLDMNLIRNIDKDEVKQLLCKAMVDFCDGSGIHLIAEGIETEEELKTLVKMNVNLGQGYFLGVPQSTPMAVAREKVSMIKKHSSKIYQEPVRTSVYPLIGNLSKPGQTFSPNDRVEDIYELLRLNPTITEFVVVDDGVPLGFMTRNDLNELFGGRYGFSLHAKKTIQSLMRTEFLLVNHNAPVDQVSRFAMQRPFKRLYNPVLVERDNKYWGMVTIKDLLEACTRIEVEIAAHSNPLTGLPGNRVIEKELLKRLFGKKPYCITYYDLDNFKAYNDAYGFNNGDLMLTLLADILRRCTKNEFVGHIGGDDFVVICNYHDATLLCQNVIDLFSKEMLSLYRDDDIANGYIVSKNRHGVTEKFALASISIAGISNKSKAYNDIEDFSNEIAQLKKKCKRQVGNYFEII